MSWGTELWDQYDYVGGHTQKGIEFCEKFINFLKERTAVEQEYARNLKKLVKSFQPKKKEEDDYQYTWAQAFVEMVKEIHDIASQHEVIAEDIQVSLSKDLQSTVTELKQERKKHLQEGTKLQEQLKQSARTLDRTKKQYEKAFRESEKALENYRLADADINLSRAEVEKQRVIMNQKAQACEESKSEYASTLQQFNSSQQEHYYKSMPQVFQHLHDMEDRRVAKVQECLQQCCQIERNIIPILNTCIDGIAKAAASVDSDQDSKQVVERHKSGFLIPGDLAFEDLSVTGGSTDNQNNHTPINAPRPPAVVSKSKKRLFGIFTSSKQTEDQKEDFSDLPPSQRKRKLKGKIDAIKKEMAKEQSEREGMVKLKDVYSNNHALGDPQTLEKKIEENAQKLDAIRQELHKFEGYLASCEGRQRRSSTSGDSVHSSDSGHQQLSVSAPGTPQQPHDNGDPDPDDFIDDFPDGDMEEELVAIGTCRALYPFEAMNDESISMGENEEMQIVEGDQGDGWTRVRKGDGKEGFVPSSYIQCHFAAAQD